MAAADSDAPDAADIMINSIDAIDSEYTQ